MTAGKSKQLSHTSKKFVTVGPSGIAHTFTAPKKNSETPDKFIPKNKPKPA